jgi:para-nitrobenzyl esterase
MLGYMAHPELTKEQDGHSGNYGYLDQNAALRWIRDNIAKFGGDPNKVVITGQSFGAGAVAAQITSPLSKGLFRGAMMTSACNFGGSGMVGGVAPLAEGEKAGLDLQKRLEAPDLAAMRNVPADRILALQEENQLGLRVSGVRAPSVIDGYSGPAPRSRPSPRTRRVTCLDRQFQWRRPRFGALPTDPRP